VNLLVLAYKGKMEGEAALSRFPKEKSKDRVQWYWKAACACRPWKPKGSHLTVLGAACACAHLGS
jgi:hypothetical protein